MPIGYEIKSAALYVQMIPVHANQTASSKLI